MTSKKRFIYFVLALIFSVAVSGGCGGGGSGRYYGDYGQDRNSSQDVTPAPESQDVTPENPVSEDQYGDEIGDENSDEDYGVNDDVQNLFSALNNTEWVINELRVLYYFDYDGDEAEDIVEPQQNTYNYNADRVRLKINDNILTWYDGDNKYHTDNLIVNFIDPYTSKTRKAPIIRAAAGFKLMPNNQLSDDYENYQVSFDKSGVEFGGNERFAIAKDLTVIYVYNDFYIDNQRYTSYYKLTPYVNDVKTSDDVRYFGMLMDSEWEIKNVSVYSISNDNITIQKCPVTANSYNYRANKLKFWTDVNQNLGDAMMWFDGNGDVHGNSISPLTVNFTDPIVNAILKAPILRAAPDFKKGYSSGDIEHCEVSLGNEGSETLSIAKSLTKMIVENHFYINERHYWCNMELSRLDSQVNYLAKLNNTEWMISNVTVTCESTTKNYGNCNVNVNSYRYRYNNKYINFPANNPANNKILFMTNENTLIWSTRGAFLMEPLTVDVVNPSSKKIITMPILRSLSGFKLYKQSPFSVMYRTLLKGNEVIGEITVGNEVIAVQNAAGVIVNNIAQVGDLTFQANLVLSPYKPKLK